MELANREVHCWCVRLDVSADACTALMKTLSSDEQGRSARLHTQQQQQRFVAAHGGLRTVLGAYVGAHPAALSFLCNQFGKPALSESFGSRLRFNLSHSADL